MIDYGSSQSKKQFTRRIGDSGFLGADFSTAPIFASPRRFRDLKNVWKDYKSGSGVAIETVPGVRKMHYPTMTQEDIDYFTFLNEDLPSSIHTLGFFVIESPVEALVRYNTEHQGEEGFEPVPTTGTFVMVHSGVELSCIPVSYISKLSADNIPDVFRARSSYRFGDVYYRNFQSYSFDKSFQVLPNHKTVTIQAKDSALILGGYWVYKLYPASAESLNSTDDVFSFHCDRFKPGIDLNAVSVSAYTPTTYLDGVPYEQKNMLTLRSREKFTVNVTPTGDDTYEVAATIYPHEKILLGTNRHANIISVTLDGHSLAYSSDGSGTSGYQVIGTPYGSSETHVGSLYVWREFGGNDLPTSLTDVTVEVEYVSDETKFTSYQSVEEYKGKTTFKEGNPGYSGTAFGAIAGCTICASFDERIFLAGNPKLPNTIFYSQRDLTGYNNPTYFGVLNYNNLGTSNAPITAMIPSATSLCVLKDDSATDPTMYFLTGVTTEHDLIPRIYTVESGLPGIGCKGAACNFLDDIVFMSKNGVIGIDKQAVNLERSLGDRSVLINGRLTREDPTKAIFAEWEGYLAVLFTNNGHLYLADSRAYTQGAGYEWYFIDSVGSWDEDEPLYEYNNEYVRNYGANGQATVTAWNGTEYAVVERETGGDPYTGNVQTVYLDTLADSSPAAADTDGRRVILVETESGSNQYYQVKTTGERVGGTFYPATCMVASNDRIFFGTGNGDLLTFNNDESGRHSNMKYTFCGHRIDSYVETEDDDAGIANVRKDTVKRSVVVDLKAIVGSRYKISTYTDTDKWNNENTATGSVTDYSDFNYELTNFNGVDYVTVQLREKTRKWVLKRYRVESNGFNAPFGLYRITYNFELNGRIK